MCGFEDYMFMKNILSMGKGVPSLMSNMQPSSQYTFAVDKGMINV